MRPRLIVGISGASGVIFGVRLLEALRELSVEAHLVMTAAAEVTLGCETGYKVAAVKALAYRSYAAGDMAAPIASGSFQTLGMAVRACSPRHPAGNATGRPP